MVNAANSSLTRANWLVISLPAALLGGAYVAQYGFGLPPCEMCWWQRYPHFIALPLGLAALLAPAGSRRALVIVAALAVLVSGLIGGFHAGVEYGWWEGLSACSSTDLGDDPLAAIMAAPLIRCDTAPWDLLGVSLAGFNFIFSTMGALAALALLRSGKA